MKEKINEKFNEFRSRKNNEKLRGNNKEFHSGKRNSNDWSERREKENYSN